MSTSIIKNTTGVTKTWGGIVIAGGSQYTLQAVDKIRVLSDSVFLTDLAGGSAVVNNGSVDLASNVGLLHLQGVASDIRFDNTVNGFPAGATSLQAAIESVLAFDPQNTTSALFDDFDGRQTWSPSTAGVSASAAVGGGNAEFASGKHVGVARCQYGSGLPSHASLVLSGTLAQNAVFGNGVADYRTLIRIPTLATVAEDYVIRIGYGTSTNADHADGIYFEYNRSVSANWLLKTASASSRTVVTSSIPVVAGSWITLSWICNSAGTSVSFYINGTLAGTITTNIPTVTGRGCGPNYQIVASSILTGGRSFVVDYFYFIKYFTARD
jgi:hypothetical protein